MFSKYKKLIVGLLGVGLVALFTQLDIKQLEKFWKAFKGALEKVYNVLQPLAESIATWGMKTLLPATITLFKEQWDNLTQMFVGIKEQLAGWNEKTGTEKFTAILGVFGVIGSFAMDTAASILDWGAKLLGYDGSLVKDIKAKWEEFNKNYNRMKQTRPNWITNDEIGSDCTKTMSNRIKQFTQARP